MNKYVSHETEIIETNMQNSQMKFSLANNYRKIILNTDIDENASLDCFYYLNKLRESDTKFNKKEPIEIYINSNGGLATECFMIVDLIEQMKNDGYEIITINMGRAYSAGMAIALCGSKRKAFSRARYMFHDVASGCMGKAQEMSEQLEETLNIRETYFSIIQKYTDISDADIQKWQERKMDKFFSAKEMKELKGIEEIM